VCGIYTLRVDITFDRVVITFVIVIFTRIRNHNLVRVEITLVRVGITFVLVEITLRVEITLCELKSHYAYEIALLCVNHTRLVVQRQCLTLVSAQY
jgi:hypothetical protein